MEPIRLKIEPQSDIDDLFVSIHQSGIQYRKANIKAWNLKNLKLQQDFKLEIKRFSYLSLAPGISLRTHHTSPEFIALDQYDNIVEFDMSMVCIERIRYVEPN